ncbi:aspartyl protease family protein [Cyanobium sp. Morenito 9A2]|uniref:aspartyl protease family protein n=1 Tax=Cyanobium sp. Morenito 9A2 TaxID=2823718 RepID=UPI0020CE3330|nr:aspartyl protease family protein [Cyanobium sp. Morenito 9A2]MCP9848346.1 aspartyl protease family protein [Cyanobium sp. Morenito 9A2]
MLALCAALLQLKGDPLAGGVPRGGATVPLERAADGDTPVLSLHTDRGRLRLLLDTGASSSMVTPEAARRLGLTAEAMAPAAFGLAGGGRGCAQLRPRRARLPELRLGSGADPLTVRSAEVLVLPVAALPAGVDGVLGVPLLKRLPIWIDPVGQRLRLGAGAVALAGPAPPRRTLPLRWARGVPLIELNSPRGPVAALADTGAEGLFLSPALAQRLVPIGPGEPLRLMGFCGEQPVQRQRFAGLGLGPVPAGAHGLENVEGIVTTNPIFAALQVEAIVGQELLRSHRQLWRLDRDPPTLSLW